VLECALVDISSLLFVIFSWRLSVNRLLRSSSCRWSSCPEEALVRTSRDIVSPNGTELVFTTSSR